MEINGEVWVEEHEIHGNGVPFSPRTVYWVRERTSDHVSPFITEVYCLHVANAVARERARIRRAIIKDIIAQLTCS